MCELTLIAKRIKTDNLQVLGEVFGKVQGASHAKALTKGVQILAHPVLLDHIALRQKLLDLILHRIRQSVSRGAWEFIPDEVVQCQSDEELAQSLDTLLLGASTS